ncbi:MAG: hypothetical protein WD995_02300 [Gemmatimonadota bacterium]
MQIDWFTLAAQTFNFVLLGFLLWHVLYRPIKSAVDEREQRIESRLEEAREQRADAESTKEEYERRKEELEGKRDELLAEAEREADERRSDLREEVKQEVWKAREDWMESLREDEEEFLDELSRRSREEIFRLTQRAITDLMGSQPEQALLDTFLRRAEETLPDERESFAAALTDAGGECRVRTSIEIPEDGAARIVGLLEKWVEKQELDLRVDVDPDGPRGIELWAGDRKIAWTVDAYVEELRQSTAEILREESEKRHTEEQRGSKDAEEDAEESDEREKEEEPESKRASDDGQDR